MFSQEMDGFIEESSDDLIHVTPLQELSVELLDECIKYQIENPFSSKTNFLEEFSEVYIDDVEGYSENSDDLETTNNTANQFYLSVLKLLNDKFSLDLDEEIIGSMNVLALKNFAEGLYEFFIIKYERNIGKYIADVIIENKDDLIKKYKDMNKETVSWVSYERKLKDPEMIPIFANISSVIKEFRTMQIEISTFIDYFNQDKFEVAVLKYAIKNNIITGDFVPKFLSPLFEQETQNDVYDDIIINVSERLFKVFRKEKLPTIEEIKKNTVGEDEDGEK